MKYPISVLTIPIEEVRERMRRHHWRQYFAYCKTEDKERADYHRALATSLEIYRADSRKTSALP